MRSFHRKASNPIKGKAILSSTGDFIDDDAVDSAERHDLSFVFILELEGGRIARTVLRPLCIEDLYVRLAKDREIAFWQRTMQAKCAAFDSGILFHDGVGTLERS